MGSNNLIVVKMMIFFVSNIDIFFFGYLEKFEGDRSGESIIDNFDGFCMSNPAVV